jgi:hypothetical protein
MLRAALAPVLADLAASGMTQPDIREDAHEEPPYPSVCAWIQGPDDTGSGIRVLLGTSPADQVAYLAEQFQNWAADQLHDAGHPPEWPACPEHPDQIHRLEPEVRDGTPVWTCYDPDRVIWAIGELTMSGAQPQSKRSRTKARRKAKQGDG